MIIKDDEAVARLNSPMNLINQLRTSSGVRNSAMQLFGVGKKNSPILSVQLKQDGTKHSEEIKIEETKEKSFNPFEKKDSLFIPTARQTSLLLPQKSPQESPSQAPSVEHLLDNSETQIKLGLAHDNALNLLSNSINLLSAKLDDVKADKLPAAISAASKVVESIRRERNEATKNNKEREVHFHFYTPTQKKVDDYEIIEVS